MAGASLRPMARAAGTSDRMLIYHFGTKDALLGAVVAHLAEDMLARLDAALPPQPQPNLHALARQLHDMTQAPDLAGHFRLWLELLGSGAQHVAARSVMDAFDAWLRPRIPVGEPDPDSAAALLLSLTEGGLVLLTAGRGDLARAAIDRALA
ncbi:TetR/AcrR family transcriptional regulator [Jannaschia sp. S6380]|uniref:TetR/AcrR family transcriptional regulator n=1 Tax=Jannaschia sp. S6380 TaxID=2926408 RepID=UPI001FF3AFB7|nr:TetR/AcrR family transcriptional regulator [Jannaschia sp. S6380]MCK0166071.1 TetR/AcrR family transcriptional regulator [Jannaschia sp. S6380]